MTVNEKALYARQDEILRSNICEAWDKFNGKLKLACPEFYPVTFDERFLSNNGMSLYYVSRCGHVYGSSRRRILSALDNGIGYMQHYLSYFGGTGQWYKVHRIVAKQFIRNPNNLTDVNHINGIKSDNRVENLEWLSHSDNIKHSFTHFGRKHYGGNIGKRIKCSDGCEYASAVEASKSTGAKTSNISMCCNGKSKSTLGLQFSFILHD